MAHGLILSTHNVPPQETAGAWRDWMSTLFFGLGSDLYGQTRFEGHLHSVRAGDVVLTQLEADRHRVIRDSHAGRDSEADYLKIVAPSLGSAAVEQHGRQAWVKPGSWAIYDTTASYEVANPERTQLLIVMLPKSLLTERGLRLDPLMGRQVGGASGIARIALEAMRSTFFELPSMSPDIARGAGESLLELVRLSLLELAGRSTKTSQMAAFEDRIRDHIGKHLRDPGLSIEHIAQALNCSKRHLHNAFAKEEDTLAHYILRRRLQACMRDLKNPLALRRTITEIAFSWGFCNVAYFSRVFREHTGLSPSEYRAAVMKGALPPH